MRNFKSLSIFFLCSSVYMTSATESEENSLQHKVLEYLESIILEEQLQKQGTANEIMNKGTINTEKKKKQIAFILNNLDALNQKANKVNSPKDSMKERYYVIKNPEVLKEYQNNLLKKDDNIEFNDIYNKIDENRERKKVYNNKNAKESNNKIKIQNKHAIEMADKEDDAQCTRNRLYYINNPEEIDKFNKNRKFLGTSVELPNWQDPMSREVLYDYGPRPNSKLTSQEKLAAYQMLLDDNDKRLAERELNVARSKRGHMRRYLSKGVAKKEESLNLRTGDSISIETITAMESDTTSKKKKTVKKQLEPWKSDEKMMGGNSYNSNKKRNFKRFDDDIENKPSRSHNFKARNWDTAKTTRNWNYGRTTKRKSNNLDFSDEVVTKKKYKTGRNGDTWEKPKIKPESEWGATTKRWKDETKMKSDDFYTPKKHRNEETTWKQDPSWKKYRKPERNEDSYEARPKKLRGGASLDFRTPIPFIGKKRLYDD